jgi:hypothetical protein
MTPRFADCPHLLRLRTCGLFLALSLSAFAENQPSSSQPRATPAQRPTASDPDPAQGHGTAPDDDPAQGDRAGELAMPHLGGSRDTVSNSAAVPPSTIDVTVLDPRSNAAAHARVALIRERHSVAQGDDQSTIELTTDDSGHVRFERLESSTDTRYRVVLTDNGARYGTRPFALDPKLGAKVVLHSYPVVRSLKDTMIFGRSFVFFEPRDQILAVEYVHEYQNVGHTVLAADSVALTLPRNWKAFSTSATDPDLSVVSTDTGVKLAGAIAPGRHSVAFTFQIPTANRERLDVGVDLWPNTADAQVATLARPGLELSAEGFPSASVREGTGRQPMLWTGRSFTQDRSAPRSIRVELSGLPTVGPGRWVAVALSALIASAALLAGLFRRRSSSPGEPSKSMGLQAQERIVDELVALEKAHQQGQIGETAFADTREILLSAFVRAAREPSGQT